MIGIGVVAVLAFCLGFYIAIDALLNYQDDSAMLILGLKMALLEFTMFAVFCGVIIWRLAA